MIVVIIDERTAILVFGVDMKMDREGAASVRRIGRRRRRFGGTGEGGEGGSQNGPSKVPRLTEFDASAAASPLSAVPLSMVP